MEEPDKSDDRTSSLATAAVVTLAYAGFVVVFMYYAYTYPYPNGEPISRLSFVMFFFKEFLLLAFIFIVFTMIFASQLMLITRYGFTLIRGNIDQRKDGD